MPAMPAPPALTTVSPLRHSGTYPPLKDILPPVRARAASLPALPRNLGRNADMERSARRAERRRRRAAAQRPNGGPATAPAPVKLANDEDLANSFDGDAIHHFADSHSTDE